MVAFNNRDFDDECKVTEALRSVYGIGYSRSMDICNKFLVHRYCTMKELPVKKLKQIEEYVKTLPVGNKLLNEQIAQKKLLLEIGTTKGILLAAGMPANGQSFSPNGKTARRLNPVWFRKREYCTYIPELRLRFPLLKNTLNMPQTALAHAKKLISRR